MAKNTTSRRCWAYETVPNTAEIVAVDSVTYFFGVDDDSQEQWKLPTKTMPVQSTHVYSKRMPNQLGLLDPKLPDFGEKYNPTTAQFLARFLGNPQTAEPITLDPLNEGQTYPITVRHEQRGGSTEKINQAVGCRTVGIDLSGEIGSKLTVIEKFAWASLEDQGDRSILTTNPLAAGALTSPESYDGRPYFEWNGTQLPEAWRVNLNQTQQYKKSYVDQSTGKKAVYKFQYNEPSLTINAVLDSAIGYTIWDDFNDGNQRDAILKFYKPDMVNYIQIDLADCYISTFKETGIKWKGQYESVIGIVPNDISGSSNFLNEGANFSTHFKAVVT